MSDSNVSIFTGGPYWWLLLQDYAVPELDVEELILNRFSPLAERSIAEVLEVELLDDGTPDLRQITPTAFDEKLPELCYRLTRAYLEAIRDVFTETVGDVLGVKPGSDSTDEWQVGELNIFPQTDADLRALVEDVHLALVPFGPPNDGREEWFGTIADRVKEALTDDLHQTMASPFFRSGEFDPRTFALEMTQRVVDSKPFDALTTVAAILQATLDRLDAARPGEHQSFSKAAEKKTEGVRDAGRTIFDGVVDGLKKAADSLDNDAVAGPKKRPSEPGKPAVNIDMKGFVGKLFQTGLSPADKPPDKKSDQ